MLGEAVERPSIVDGVYDKRVLDIDTPELLEEVGEYESIDHSMHDAYGEEAEQDRSSDDPYGGMPIELYDNIVESKGCLGEFQGSSRDLQRLLHRTGTYPANIGSRHDRSAYSHWRSRCLRFVLADDNETLLYYNPSSSVNDQPKVVVKRGEVRRVIERIHDLIGHLGQKRTQIVVLKKLHWRSVRQDVKTFINSCPFCNQKKLEGKKILKAPVDVTSDNFDLNVEVRTKTPGTNDVYDRLAFSLIGYNEHEVRAAAVTRMTTYTFKETASELRGRFPRPSGTTTTNFRRQPYIKRTRYSPYASGFILPYAARHKNDEPGFIEIFQDDRGGSSLSTTYSSHVYPVEELAEGQHMDENSVEQSSLTASMSRSSSLPIKTEVKPSADQLSAGNKQGLPSTSRTATYGGGRLKKNSKSAALGLAARFNLSLGDSMDRLDRPGCQFQFFNSQSPQFLEKGIADLPIEREVVLTNDGDYMFKENNQRLTEFELDEEFGAELTVSNSVGSTSENPKSSLNARTKAWVKITSSGTFPRPGTTMATEPCDNTELLSSYESVQSRPEMSALPPVMLMPSVDPEVIHMQKELLVRQLRLQRMQEKVLQAQFNSLRLPIARYEEIDPEGERVQLLGEEDDEFIAEAVEEEQELNVMNSGDESGDEIIQAAQR